MRRVPWRTMLGATVWLWAASTAAQSDAGDASSGGPGEEASAAGEDSGSEPHEAVGRVLTTAGDRMVPGFAIWESEAMDGFIKPVLQLSSTLVTYVPHSDVNEELGNRTSTLLLTRFGLEGQLFEYVTFRTVFERNMGFTLGRNGPVGTSVWEGTASWQARDSYIQLSRWGLSLAGGIVPDPASIDFISDNVLDAFGMDPYVRDPLLVSGFNQGQGLLLRYNWRWLTAGFSYTGGNPLVSSLSFGFGGDVSSLGTLFSAPLRALSNGVPGSDIHMDVISPSLTFESDRFDIKLAAQIYFVDTDITNEDDQSLSGHNLRATMQGVIVEDVLRLFATAAYRNNQQLDVPDLTARKADFEGLLFGGGADLSIGSFGFGGNYYWLESRLSEGNELTNQYVNVGLTYWLWEPNVSVGARYARSMAEATTLEPRLKATDSFILSMRLLI